MEAGEREENLRRQEEEAEALAAIYGDDFSSRVGDAGTVWEIRVPLVDPDDPTDDAPRTLHTRDGTPAPAHLIARVVPIESYPSSTPPLLEVHPPNALTHDRMDECIGAMDESYRDGGDGEVCVFAFVTRLREMAETWVDEDRPGARDGDEDEDVDDAGREEGEAGAHTWDPDALEAELAALAIERSAYDASADTAVNADNTNGAWTEESLERSIVTGVPFTEKKSTFQGYLLSNVRSVAQVEAMLRALRRNTRIAKCSHLMAAWRIRVSGTPGDADDACTWAQDHDEDGEAGAGKGMSHLLRVTKAADVCVVVARWFGGIHLGPARFSIINNCARDMLDAGGHIEYQGKGKGR